TARALRLTEPLAAGRLALLLARHASVEGTGCDRLVGDLARVLATSSSPWAELGAAELAAHDAHDADALRACAARWRAAGFVLDAARVDHAAVRTEMRARRRDVHTDTMLGLVAEFGRAGARADADRVARALRGSSRHSVAGHQAALVALRSPLLVGLSDEARREIARACTCTSLRRGQSLAGAGTSWSGDGLLLVVAGRVRLSSTAPSGKVLAVDVLDPGAVWGADLRDDALDAPLEATATEASEVAVLQRATLEALVDRHPQLGLNLSRVLADGLVRARTMSQQLAYWSVEDRFSSLLLDFDARYGETGADGSRRLGKRFAQGELAELIGTRRETVNQLLVELRRHGIVTTDDDQHLVITDETMLRARVAGR
ncbi:MAG: Transcriptional regulator, Crp/Fnr family, partial [Thermoleophilia bacterium]|nr:Transcriptional regulator, Crp/Fnr family [Thermoleophilia bacterium]